MKLKQLAQVMLVTCSLLTLSACTSTAKRNNMMADAGNSGQAGAEAAGIGENENFGDGGGAGGRHAANKNTYYFDFDKSDIRPEDKPAILASADRLAAQPNKKIILEGHTDPRGSREYNIALGERRANNVADLMATKGVSRSQVRVVSYGAERPAADGRSEQDFQLDRRAVLDNSQG